MADHENEVQTNIVSFTFAREQCDREQALEDFKTGEVRVLVATDVASRGLDVKDITCVVNLPSLQTN